MANVTSCKRHLHFMMLLWGVATFPLVLSMVSIVDGVFSIVNHSGRDLEADCGGLRWTISVGERTVVTAAMDGGLEVLGPLELFKSLKPKQQVPNQMCRVEAGNCFLSWDPVKVSHHSINQVNSNGDYEWEVDKTGVRLMLQGSRWSTAAGTADYEMQWEPTSQLLSGATQCMCGATSSPLAQAFYSVLLYFRE